VKHSILCASWRVLTTGEIYRDLGGDYLQRRDPERTTERLVARAQGARAHRHAPGGRRSAVRNVCGHVIQSRFLFVGTSPGPGAPRESALRPPTQVAIRVEPLDAGTWLRTVVVASTALVAVEANFSAGGCDAGRAVDSPLCRTRASAAARGGSRGAGGVRSESAAEGASRRGGTRRAGCPDGQKDHLGGSRQ
jgi:hypothetical protein